MAGNWEKGDFRASRPCGTAGPQVPQAGWQCRSLGGFPLASPCSRVCRFLKQPHNILQKRLMETNLSKLRSSRGSWAAKSESSAHTNKLSHTKLGSSGTTEDEEELIVVSCQVMVPPQPSGVFSSSFISDSLRQCSCSPPFSIGAATAVEMFSLKLRAAMAQVPTWVSQRKLI